MKVTTNRYDNVIDNVSFATIAILNVNKKREDK